MPPVSAHNAARLENPNGLHKLFHSTAGGRVSRSCLGAGLSDDLGLRLGEVPRIGWALSTGLQCFCRLRTQADDAVLFVDVDDLWLIRAGFGVFHLSVCDQDDQIAGADRSEEHTSELQSRG